MRTLRLTRCDAWHSAPPPHPHPLHNWLTDRGSLTARIVLIAPQFNLVRLVQCLQLPHRDERRELCVRAGELAVVREVLLRNGNTALVFAHSVLARRDLQGAWRGLSRLGSRPLAEMLFHDPTVSRLPMEYKQIDRRHPLFQRAASATKMVDANMIDTNKIDNALWARRSVFVKRGRPLLVTEVFLSWPGADKNSVKS